MSESSVKPGGPLPGDQSSTTENVIDTYQITAEWIRFADTKAAVVLTVNGALASVLIPTLQEVVAETPSLMAWIVIAVFAIWSLVTLGSCISAFGCILPYRRDGRHPALERCRHFHPAAISEHYKLEEADRFRQGFQSAGGEGFLNEVLAALLIDSHISANKYQEVSKSIRRLAWAAGFGFAYLLLAQLV